MNTKSEPPESSESANGGPLIARDATYHRAPDELRARLHASLAKEARAQRVPLMRRALWNGFGLALACAAVAVLTWNVAAVRLRTVEPTADQRLAAQVVNAHLRSLMAPSHLNDVASTDRHTVKPWFEGKLDFAPPVADFAAEGFALTGGRLDAIEGRAAAALTYRYRQHVVNFFVWPAEGAPQVAPHVQTRQGFSLVGWSQGGMRYCVVADVAPENLLALAALLRGEAS
jgi:anti-sigma factor RsiW